MKLKFFLLLIMVGLLVSACSDDSPVETLDVEESQLYGNEASLMGGYVECSQEMTITGLDWALHEDFRFMILPGTIDFWQNSANPLARGYFDKSEVLAIHENMFTGEGGHGPSGDGILGLDSINVDVFEQDGPWESIGEGVEFFGEYPVVYKTQYYAIIYFSQPDNHRLEISESLDVYIIPVSIGGDSGFQLLGIRSLLQGKVRGVDSATYCSILALYR